MHWRTQCHTKWPSVQHSSGIEPKLPYSLLLTFTTNLALSHWFISIAQKKLYITLQISSPATDFLHRTVVLGFFKMNIKAGQEKREFLNANLLSIHLIAINIYWSWNICTSCIGLQGFLVCRLRVLQIPCPSWSDTCTGSLTLSSQTDQWPVRVASWPRLQTNQWALPSVASSSKLDNVIALLTSQAASRAAVDDCCKRRLW